MANDNKGCGRTSSSKIWQAHISAWRRSGLSRKEYCRQQQLSYDAFVYWKGKLDNKVADSISLVPVAIQGIVAPGNQLQGEPGLKIDLGNRCKIEVYDGFAPTTLAQVISVLRGC